MNNSLTLRNNKTNLRALDRDFYRANIRHSIALIIKTPRDNSTWRKGIVTIALKDGALHQRVEKFQMNLYM